MSNANKPSSVYVFVVLSLAAFLILFTICRRSTVQYVAEVRMSLPSNDKLELPTFDEIRATLLSPETILDALRAAGMIQGDANREMLDIAAEIATRVRVDALSNVDASSTDALAVKLALATEHPQVGMRLLDQMLKDLQSELPRDVSLTVSPSLAARVRGTSISAGNLVLILMCSALIGLGGIVWREDKAEANVLLTEDEVESIAKLPVLVDFSKAKRIPASEEMHLGRRQLKFVLRAAEIAVAAALLLMLFNVATVPTFSELVAHDPLAAYSEALGRILS